MKVPQLDMEGLRAKDVVFKKSEWVELRRALSMRGPLFHDLTFSGYIINSKPIFSVEVPEKAVHRILRLSFTKSDLTGRVLNDYLLDVVRDALGIAYLSLVDEYQQKIAFLNVMYGEVFTETGDIEEIDLTIHLVVDTDVPGTLDTETDLNRLTAVLLANIDVVLEEIAKKAEND